MALICLAQLLLWFPGAARAAKLDLAWNRNPERNVTGYEVRYGTRRGRIDAKFRVAAKPRATVTGLEWGKTYFFSVVAINSAGSRSVPSEELRYRLPVNLAPAGRIASPATNGSIQAGGTVRFSADGSDPDGDTPLKYRWNFGSGSGIANSTQKNPGSVRFNRPGTYRVTLTVTDAKGTPDPTPSVRIIRVLSPPPELIPRSGWRLKYVNSEEPDGYAATASFDGDPKTFWHTRWRAANLPKPPHQIQIDLGTTRHITGFRYLPRQDNFTVGNIGRFQFYVSADGKNWGAPVASGGFASTAQEKQVPCKPKTGRYVRLVSLTEANGHTDCNVAELNILQGPMPNRRPVGKAAVVNTRPNKQVRVRLGAHDPDGNPLSYKMIGRPKHGRLIGNAPNLIYKPDKRFTGTDRIRYRVFDGKGYSKTVTVRVRVKRPSPAKSASSPSVAAVTVEAETATAPPRIEKSVARSGGLKYRVLTYHKPERPDGTTPRVEVSSNLIDWFGGSRHTKVIADNERLLRVRDNTPFNAANKRHIRLRRK